MAERNITPITMPKWGLSMQEGKVNDWLVTEGTEIKRGDEILDIETEKIANVFEALDSGLLRKQVAQVDETLPIGALLGVLAPAEISDAEVAAFIAEFQANYVPPDPDEDDTGPAYEWANVEAYRLRYSRLGEQGPNVVFIHGFGGDINNWLFNQTALSTNAVCYALDLPGHGESSKTISDGSVNALAEVVSKFMMVCGIDKAHLVGHSLGGAIAAQLAASHPAQVASLTLLASAGFGPEINGDYVRGFINAESRRELKPHLQQLVANKALITRQLIDDVLKFKRLDGVSSALKSIASGFSNEDRQSFQATDIMRELNCDVRVAWGTADHIIPVEHASNIPEAAACELLADVGHLLQMEAAAEVNALIEQAFLK